MNNTQLEPTVTKLYEFIAKMTVILEQDLDNLRPNDHDLVFKRDITSIATKLVSLIFQLGKLSKSENLFLSETLPEEDQAILKRFMERYKTCSHAELPATPSAGYAVASDSASRNTP